MTYRYTPKDLNDRFKGILTEEQLYDLKCRFLSDYVDGLSVSDLKDIAYENFINDMHDWSQEDVINEVKDTFDKAYLSRLIKEVTNMKWNQLEDPW